MKAAIGCLVGLVFVVGASAEPMLEGRVRLASGEPVAYAQVQVFDMTDLQRGAVAQATTDGTGYFSLPLAGLPGLALPTRFELGANYPNPFNPATIIPYQLAASSPVRLEVFNLLGQRIATLVEGEQPAGSHTARWQATDAAGRAVGAGVYLYRLTVGEAHQTGRMVLVDGQAGVPAVGGDSVWPIAAAQDREYGLVVSGQGIAPYVVPDFRIQAGMAAVDLVVEAHPAGTVLGDDCVFCDLFDVLNDDDEGLAPAGKAQATLAAPAAPTNLRFEAVTDSSCRVRWDAAEGATDYDVNYKPAVGGKWTNEPHKGIRLYNTIYDLEPNTEYRWAARAENRDGSSEWVFGPNFTTLPDNDAPVTIPDANLRAAIEAALGKASGAPITVAEMATLTSLDARNKGIRSLTGLEFAANLTSLDLGAEDMENEPINSNDISNLSPLSRLTNLTRLNLNRNSVSDISALASLTNLTWLALWDNSVSDLSPLSRLTNLTGLDLNGNGVSDISALASLTNLTWLVLMVNSISDISPLVVNTGLGSGDEVYLWSNPLSCTALNTHIPALQSRGVTVHSDGSDGGSDDDCDTRLEEAVDDASETISDANLRPVIVVDRFGREVNDTGITLVDWEGYIANPAMKYTVKAPSGATVTRVTLSSSEPRLHFNLPSWNGVEGSRKKLDFSGTLSQAEFYISIFPDRDGLDEVHSLTIEYRDGNRHTQTIDVHVIDQDVSSRALDFDITLDFSQDQTVLFNDSVVRETVQQAADDWAHFIDDMDLDQVSSGQEESWIWDTRGYSHGGKPIRNKMNYTGFLLYAYGVRVVSGGQPSFWSYQSVNGVSLSLRRSGNISIDTRGNYNTLGWMTSLPDEEWWKATNFGDVQNDLYSIVLHEIGHALVFNPGYDEFDKFKELGYVKDPAVKNYYDSYPAIDRFDHLPETIDPVSRRGAFGCEYGGEILLLGDQMPLGRWLITKGHLLIAQAIGYTLRETSPFTPLSIAATPSEGTLGTPYSYTATVSGGTPAYHWAIESGTLPKGLSIDSFTGTLSGTPKQQGTFNFTLSVSDCDETTPSITRAVTLNIRERDSS